MMLRATISRMADVLGTDASGKIEFRQLTKDRVEDVIALQTRTMKTECIALGVGIMSEIGAAEEIQMVFRNVVEYGVTVVGVDVDTDEVVAVAFNKIHVRPENPDAELESLVEKADHETCQELINFVHSVESQVNLFERYNVKGAMELAYIGTDSRYQGRGIGYQISRVSIELARGLLKGAAKKKSVTNEILLEDVAPEIIFGVFASNYSQKISERLSFESLAECRYEDHVAMGKKMSERIGPLHKSARLAVLKL